ncbi:Transcriptional regulator with HTH domain and aminotransferase domain [uncultured Sphingopyxis sp.]|uniref:Transcriptional regulator with HTH domain and aminotransferase domain n=1 Tax=uncultured Sphingopyxis sp. TaxID=310581 RepID=A0A1Y5PYN0_9SPHN|nr:PLP-dependent aminotransferase family protein [uncultured Sphingopyxis sp.]SBV32334.1 Transcriptional regulator with HTH domain and aminotransferase domain [uncultured Sphingopyxis sp.]
MIEASRAAGTRVARRPRTARKAEPLADPGSFISLYQEMTQGPALFQMGVPATETFPATLFARLRAHAIRAEASAAPLYPDPRGEIELRREIAGYLAVARGIHCSPSQVIITGGYSAGLGLTLSVLRLAGETAWIEEPGFPWSRKGLKLAGLSLAPIAVDGEGIDVGQGICHHPGAKLALVTPGQQAPLGATLSLERRLRLLEWASERESWIIEDDYLSDLQLSGRAAPALAALDRGGRVLHIGSFSKTLSPTLRLGFVVAPPELAGRFADVAACLAPPPGPAVQLATAGFMREGHYLRHLRRTKRAYAAKREALLENLRACASTGAMATPGLAVLLELPKGVSDVAVAREALAFGMSPSPLSAWYASADEARSGLLLGVATAPTRNMARACVRLFDIIRRFVDLPGR